MSNKSKLTQNEIGITSVSTVVGSVVTGCVIVAIGLMLLPAYPLYLIGPIGAGIGISTGMFGAGSYHFTQKRIFGAVAALLGGAGMGAGIGAILGTLVFPGIGTLVGAGIGAGIGFAATLAGCLLGVLINCCRARSKSSPSEIIAEDFINITKDSNPQTENPIIHTPQDLESSTSCSSFDKAEEVSPPPVNSNNESKTDSSNGLFNSKLNTKPLPSVNKKKGNSKRSSTSEKLSTSTCNAFTHNFLRKGDGKNASTTNKTGKPVERLCNNSYYKHQ